MYLPLLKMKKSCINDQLLQQMVTLWSCRT